MVGLLVEPIANYFDRYILTPVIGLFLEKPSARDFQDSLVEEEIRNNYLGSLSGRLSKPYMLCKEYVETKNLSTTFMVFLARYGFYRNCAFLLFLAAVIFAFLCDKNPCALLSMVVGVSLSLIFKRRADEFYSFMAPAVYHAFLIDKLEWSQEKKKSPRPIDPTNERQP